MDQQQAVDRAVGQRQRRALVEAPHWPRLWLFDFYQRLDPAHHDPAGITIIDVDGESVRQVGRWPWPRDRLAQIIGRARAARAIGVDILLLEPDRTSAGDPDAQLATAIAGSRVVLAAARDDAAQTAVIPVTPIVQAGSDAQDFVPGVSQVAWPLPIFGRPASGTGLTLVLPERDGVVRRLPTLFAAGATLLPSFALEVLRVAGGETLLRVRSGALGVEQLSIGGRSVDTDANGAVWPHFSSQVPARTVSAYRVLAGEVDPALLDGRIVLIGSSLAGLGDVHLTPLRNTETGTAINAQFLASVLAGDTLWRPAVADVGEALVLWLLGIASVLSFDLVSRPLQAGLVAGVAAGLAVSSFVAFSAAGILLDWTLPVVGTVVINLGLAAMRARDDRRAMRRAETGLAAAMTEIEQARSVVAQALNSTKLAMLGEMATVLAHELRQPIATMSLAAENAEAALQDGTLDVADARVRIDRIIGQAKRAESMIDHLGVFARAEPGNPVPVDLAATIRDALQLIEPSLRRHGIGVEVRCEPGLPTVRAVKILLEQVVINLCINAQDALADGAADGRAIVLSLRSSGGFVHLEVADSGPGLPGTVMARLFEPFFTTKPAGAGTGLGLSVCRGIVESCGGSIAARNGPEGGAVFTVNLPVNQGI